MLFNSVDFAIFLPIVFVLYWFVTRKSLRLQNLMLVGASYLFYGWWDWRFLSLILFSTLVDYFVGLGLKDQENGTRRKLLLLVSILVNLGFLGFFKYYNFFLDNFTAAFSFFGQEIKANSLHIILPVGISFYTFQTMSYSLDVYKRKIEPTRDFIAFAAFVGFFPQLVAGPIERAANLLPQFDRKRTFEYAHAVDGMRQMLWGLFKKVVIADNCAEIADHVFGNSANQPGSALLLGVLCFAFQIYCDFSGYSDMAIGTARLFGFRLMRNFAFPYFSRDIAEFWRRWHISLSTWFRDYLYIPLGGSRGGIAQIARNTLIIFLVSGFWHGANWTFIIWGLLNALYFLPLIMTSKNRRHMNTIIGYDFDEQRHYTHALEYVQMFGTFALTLLAWIFFRAENLQHAWQYLSSMFSISMFSIPARGLGAGLQLSTTLLLVLFFLVIEWKGRYFQHALEKISDHRMIRWSVYAFLVFMVGMYMQTSEMPFIYFQF